ncbi:hypothetical protein CPB83DRAFT_525402 [Crepidotus variabilis]|uniref:Fungal-type protein kinase domain-containing protein n=1 Tax=Crepidotus variabilis TaxID=179855 RepID=A0A9P6EPT4_9AGAR|nr:hypothetical protein CPB83DRAFT_525402 [Crepidotus variabilis]
MSSGPLTEMKAKIFFLRNDPPQNTQPLFFKTIGPLSVRRSDYISHRATRVWLVEPIASRQNVESTGETCLLVLKDTWSDIDAQTEKEIQDALFNDIKCFSKRLANAVDSGDWSLLEPDERDAFGSLMDKEKEPAKNLLRDEGYRKHFVTILQDWKGRTLKPPGSQAESIRAVPLFYQSRPRQYPGKTQHRVLCKEICEPLDDVKTFGEVIVGMEGAVSAMLILFLAGWVHRDISASNVMMYQGQGVLGDLEVAKRFRVRHQHSDEDFLKGTPYFMATEIYKGFTQARYPRPTIRTWDFTLNPKPDKRIPFQHNFLHDLESIWWILLWTMLQRVPFAPSHQYAAGLFVNTRNIPQAREEAFVAGGALISSLFTSLHPCFLIRDFDCTVDLLRCEMGDTCDFFDISRGSSNVWSIL